MNKKNRGMLMSTSMLVLAVTVTLLCCSRVLGRVDIPFKGNATGGKLVIGYIPDPHSVHTSIVSIDTSAGEPADSVVNRLATAITFSDAIFSNMSKNPKAAETMRKEMAKGNTLSIRGMLGDYILAGTETGLGIPEPPLFLSCSYDKQDDKLELKWVNPRCENQYDSIFILWRYRSRPEDTLGSGGVKLIWDTPTNFIIKLPEEVNDLDTDIWIKGLRHEMPMEEMRAKDISLTDNVVPSNVAAIHVTSNGYCQEETYGIPFSAGVAPNWKAWSTAAKVDKATFEQGDKYAGVRLYKPVRALLTKPYYQIIKAQPSGVVHGVYRKFLGLTPGHTYRLTACLTTLDMDPVKGDWSLSLCAIPNRPDGKDLSPQQLAGLAHLPDGRGGPQEGRIAYYGPGKTTKGDFALTFSGDKTADGLQSSHITLPPDANTITVWVRFSCSDPNGKIGFSGVKLEDISASRDVKSPEQILLEENQQEAELLMWQEKVLRERPH
jgi:hypothetical protein